MKSKAKDEIGHWLWVPRQWKHGQPQGNKLLCARVTLSGSEGPGWSVTALGHLKQDKWMSRLREDLSQHMLY